MKKRKLIVCGIVLSSLLICFYLFSGEKNYSFTKEGIEYAVLVNDTPSTSIPDSGYYSVEVNCNNSRGKWNYDDWVLEVANITGDISCELSFHSYVPSDNYLNDYIMNRSVGTCSSASYTTASTCTSNGGTWATTAASGSCSIPSYTTKAQCDAATAGACYNLSNITLQSSYTTESTCRAAGYSWKKATWNGVFNENGFRYEGKDPNNYVWFNNEMWRIIGVFDNYYNDNTTHDYLVKLIKAEPIGSLVWHYTTGVRWKDSSLYSLLNNYYYNGSDYPLDLTSTTSACSSYEGNRYVDCRYSKSGITNSEYRNMIANAWWNNQLVTSYDLSTVYTNESVNDATYTVNAKVGLMYLSDYGYGVIGDNNGGSCARTTPLDLYNSSTCAGQNWIYGKSYEWTMTQYVTSYAWYVNSDGYVYSNNLYHGFALRPSVFLSSMVYYIDGDGSYENPYIIGA